MIHLGGVDWGDFDEIIGEQVCKSAASAAFRSCASGWLEGLASDEGGPRFGNLFGADGSHPIMELEYIRYLDR